MLVSRGAGITDKTTGVVHAVVVWALGILAATWLIVTLLASLAGGALSAAKSTGQAARHGVANAAQAAGGQGGDRGQQFNPNTDEALRPVNDRLRAAGKPTISPEQLRAAAKEARQNAVQQRRFDRQSFVRALEDNHVASGADADDIAGRVEAQFNAAEDKLSTAGQTAENAGGKAARVTGKTLWGIFAVLLLGAAATILGAIGGLWRGRPSGHVAAET